MQRKEQLLVSALGNEKLEWGGQQEPPGRTWVREPREGGKGGNEGTWITPNTEITFQASDPNPRPG